MTGADDTPSAEGHARSEPLTVMLVDDHPSTREGLRAGMERAGIAVVAESADGADAIDRARELMPDVVVMDLRMPIVSGVDATRQIVEDSPHVKVLVVSVSDEEGDVLEAIKAGACGYLLKTAPTEDVVDAVRRVAGGETPFTPRLATFVINEMRRASSFRSGEPALTDRENEILRLVARGYSYGEIAGRLFISEKTVQNHVRNILSKLHMRKRYELMAYAIHKGYDRAPD